MSSPSDSLLKVVCAAIGALGVIIAAYVAAPHFWGRDDAAGDAEEIADLKRQVATLSKALESKALESKALEEQGQEQGTETPDLETDPMLSISRQAQLQESLGFEFRLLGCQVNARRIVCDLTVKNLRQDRVLYLKKAGSGRGYGETRGFQGARIFDENSSEFFAGSIQLASAVGEGESSVGPEAMLISNLEVPLKLSFQSIPHGIKRVSRMFLDGWDRQTMARAEIVFEDIPLTRAR